MAPPTQGSGLPVLGGVAGPSPSLHLLAACWPGYRSPLAPGCWFPFAPHSPSRSPLAFSPPVLYRGICGLRLEVRPAPSLWSLRRQRCPCNEGQRQLCRPVSEPFPLQRPLFSPFGHMCHTQLRKELLSSLWRPRGSWPQRQSQEDRTILSQVLGGPALLPLSLPRICHSVISFGHRL